MPHELSRERKERRLTMVLFMGTMVLMLALTYITNQNMQDHVRTTRQLRFLNALAMALEDVRGPLLEQESGARGYLLTNDSTYLQHYFNALATRPGKEETLRILVSGTRFDGSVDSLLQQTKRATDMHQQLVLNAERGRGLRRAEKERLELGRGTMEQARSLFQNLAQDIAWERERQLGSDRNEGTSPYLLVISSLLGLLTTALLVWRLSHALRRTERAKYDLRMKVRDLDAEITNRRTVQELLQQVMETSPAGIMTMRTLREPSGGILDLEWTMANHSACQLLDRDQLVGSSLLGLFPAFKSNGLFDEFIRVLNTGAVSHGEVRHTENAVDRWFMYDLARLEDGLLMVFTDITEQRYLQRVAKDKERFDLIGQITRTLAHEVRNPLTNIHLSVEQLQDEVGANATASALLEIMHRNLRRIGGLIKEMLESTRRQAINMEEQQLPDMVRAAMAAIKDRSELQQITVTMEQDPGDLTVKADRGPFVLAVTNILVNAVEAMQPGQGRLLLHMSAVHGHPILRITDNGHGMTPEVKEKLFTPFFSKRSGGLGLGLATTRSILDVHQVSIEVNSSPGQGTTFVLRFP